MHTFKDREDRTWTLDINVAAIQSVRKKIDVNLLSVLDDDAKLLSQIGSDPVRLVEILWALVEEQAQAVNVTPEGFARGFSGDVLLSAKEALLAELIDFFPDRRVREALAETIGAAKTVAEKVVSGSRALLQTIDMDEEAEEILGPMRERLERIKAVRQANAQKLRSGNASASSDSTPDRTRSENSA